MSPSMLVLDDGSSSLKFALHEADAAVLGPLLLRGEFSGIGSRVHCYVRDKAGTPLNSDPSTDAIAASEHEAALHALLAWMNERVPSARSLRAVGPPSVHGSERYDSPLRIGSRGPRRPRHTRPARPLHQSFGPAGIQAVISHDPELPPRSAVSMRSSSR